MRSIKSIAMEILMVVLCFSLFLGALQWFDESFDGWVDFLTSVFFFAVPYAGLVAAMRYFRNRRASK